MSRLKANQEVDVHSRTMDADGFEGKGILIQFLKSSREKAVGGKYDGQKVEFEQWKVQMLETNEIKSRFFVVEDIRPKLGVEEVKTLILEQGLDISTVIDAVIDLNGFIGVGLITLGDNLQSYCHNKIKRQ